MRAGPDVVVVGGGLIGAAITWRLAHEGHEVSWLVDPAQSGSASAASGAMLAVYSEVSAHEDDAVVGIEVEARSRGLAAWTDWLPDVAAASGRPVAVTQGLYVVAGTGADVAGLAAIRAAAAAHGGTAVSVDPTDVPGLHADAGLEPSQAMYLPGEASVDSAVLLGALTEACRSLPTVLISVDRAVRVEAQGDGSRVTTATGETFDAAQVVLATGVETSALLAGSELDGLLPPMFGGRGVSLLVRAPEPTVACIRTPNRAFACGLHIVPRADGLTYLGATNRLTTQPELDARATLDEINQVSSGVLRELDTRLRRAELVSAAVATAR